MNDTPTTVAQTDVYLLGDPVAVETTLTVAEIVEKLRGLDEIGCELGDPGALIFISLPRVEPHEAALVRTSAISALVPVRDDD
jgi:hypothetical protein